MDSKIKEYRIQSTEHRLLSALAVCLLSALAVCFPSCKQNNWMDWKVQNEIWLDQNKLNDSVQVSKTGLQYKIIADPTPQDARPNTNSSIICDYKVYLITNYDWKTDKPTGLPLDAATNVTLSLSSTIPGFSEGCHKIHCNGDIHLYIPSYLGYDYSEYQSKEPEKAAGIGTEGTQSFIPPYSTLIYDIHVCGIAD